MPFNNEIEKTKKEIEVLTAKLALLKEMENHKTPCEIAFKDWWGVYPGTEIWTNFDETRWVGFKAGYNAAYEQKVSEEQLATQKGNIKTLVEESVKWCEEHPDKDPLDWVKPQTPEQVADGLKEAFREAVKQGVVSSSTKPQTLTDLIYDWWERVFGDTDDTETCIDNLVDEISLWLPTEHDTNSYKWNECIRMIREKLR